jgi:hypothetical protein
VEKDEAPDASEEAAEDEVRLRAGSLAGLAASNAVAMREEAVRLHIDAKSSD